MQKKIIVLAIAAALTAPALAYAEATVYGQVNLAYDRYATGAASSNSYNQLKSYGSRLGFKGSEALDGGMGMSVIWALESGLGVDNGNAGATYTVPTVAPVAGDKLNTQLFDRLAYVGLKSDSMGTVALGLQDTPYKSSTRKLDVFGDTVADNRRLMGVGHDVAVSNAITYMSPSMSGFSIAAGTVFGAEDAPTTSPTADKKGTALSLAAMYEQDAIYATLAVDNTKYGDAETGDLAAPTGFLADDKASAFKVGVGYGMDAIAVNAVVEQTKITKTVGTTSTDTKNTNIYLGGKFNLSSTDAVKLAFTKRGDTKTGSTTTTDNVTQMTLGYDHGMSKNTTVYALYSKLTAKATGAADPSVWSFGIKHAF